MDVKTGLVGLKLVDEYYRNYGTRARELKRKGHKFIGYLCALTPLEIINASGFIPFRIKGNVNESISKADTYMETIVCPLVRSCFDMTLKQNYEFLDGLVLPHACDSICRTYDTWKYTLDLPYSHFLNIPHDCDDSSLKFYKAILRTFVDSLEKYSGKTVAPDSMLKSIQLYNTYRAKIRHLYEFRRLDSPLIKGEEFTKTLVAGLSIPINEAIDLIDGVISEVTQRHPDRRSVPRLMIIGAQLDNASIPELIENIGADVVVDELCPGLREYASDVENCSDPIDGIAERYLNKVFCSRTYRVKSSDYTSYLDERFGHIKNAIKKYNVDGAILYFYKYCDPFGFEVPALKNYLESIGVRVLNLEDEYSMSGVARLRTRIEAFIEILQLKNKEREIR